MTFGVKFNTVNGERQIDESFMVPEFLGKITLGSPIVENVGSESSYLVHRYGGSVPDAGGRPVMIFWTIPSTANDVWLWPQDQFIWSGNSSSFTGVQIYYASGTTAPAVPEGYAFALGNATSSGEQFCMRVWNAGGALIFDSGRVHLNLDQVLSGISMPDGSTSTTSISVPAKPAFLVPSVVRDQESYSRFDDSAHFEEWLGCARRNGSTLYTRMVLVNDFEVAPGSGLSYHEDQTYGNTTGLSMPVINAALYD